MLTKDLMNAVLCTVCEAGDRGVPAGHVYAALMGKLTLDDYNAMQAFLEREGLVRVDHFLLRPTAKLEAAYSAARAKSTGAAQ